MYHQARRYKLTPHEYRHYCGSYVRLTPLQYVTSERINIHGIRVRAIDAYKHNFTKATRKLAILGGSRKSYTEIAIDDRVLRINLRANCLNLIVTNDLFTVRRKQKNALMHSNDELNKSIIKSKENGRQSPVSTPSKTVSFNNTFYIKPISPRHRAITPPQQNSYENTFKEYLKKMNGPEPQKSPIPANPDVATTATSITETQETQETPEISEEEKAPKIENEDENEEDMEVEMLEDEPPRRGRGRPRGSGRVKQYVPRPPPRDPNTPPKRRGWPLGLPRKKFTTYKNVHRPYGEPSPPQGTRRGPGRPRKIVAFGFQTIVTDIKSVNLPSELWSAHVSVTSKRSQVCFTRVVQNKSNTIPVECDRSVKFNGTVKYLVRINNRDVALIAAPAAVNSLRDIEILLNIVNDISQNDPVLEYFNR